MDVFTLIANALKPRSEPVAYSVNPSGSSGGMASFAPSSYSQTTRAYLGNEIVAAGLGLLTDAVAEPHIIGRRYRRNRAEVRTEARWQKAMGISNRAGQRMIDAHLVRNGFWEEVEGHPLVKLLNNPNPYTSRGQFWGSIAMDYFLAGNAYGLKARYREGMIEGATGELWRLRPDRIKPIPGDMSAGEPFIKGYEYTVDSGKKTLPAEDVLHFKHPNPLNPYEGASPLLALLPRVEIDWYMRRFLGTFFDRGGAGVGASLNIKGGSISQEQKDDLRTRFKQMFTGGQYDILVTSADDVTYTPFSLNRGLRDALPKEIDAVTEARVSMVLGIPGSILGLLIGYETSSYANQRQAWQVLWDVTMTPLLSGFDDVLNLSLVPEFGGIDEVCFDLSDITALQEDEEALQERARKNVAARIWTMEEGRLKTGIGDLNADDHFLLPDGSAIKVSELDNMTPMQEPTQLPAAAAVALLAPPRVGRTRLEDDPVARADYEEALDYKSRYPGMTWAQIAGRVGRSERQLRELRARFADMEDDDADE